jgi:hypothetical protein
VRDIPCGIFLTALENDGISRVQSDLNLKSFSHVVGAVGSGTLLDDILRCLWLPYLVIINLGACLVYLLDGVLECESGKARGLTRMEKRGAGIDFWA